MLPYTCRMSCTLFIITVDFCSLRDSQCNVILFVFTTINPKKLLKLLCLIHVKFLKFKKNPLKVDPIQLQERLSEGLIEDIGVVNDVHVYVYKFSMTTKCSNASPVEVYTDDEYIPQFLPTKLKANIGWYFFTCMVC